MRSQNSHLIYFSPGGTTEIMVKTVGKIIAYKNHYHNLLRTHPPKNLIPNDDLAIVGMPVYGGKLPTIARQRLEQFRGENTPVIALVSYGNRAYDNALLEIKNILTSQGFTVLGAGAFIAQHAIFSHSCFGKT